MTPPDDETRVFTPAVNAEADPHSLVGTVLAGRYRIQELLGVGAMGAVYLGEHLKIHRKDAIKILHSSIARDPDAIARFDRGARNVGAIRHPNVCTIYDFSDTADGLQYLAMEFVSGESLKDILDREGPLQVERAVDIAEQAASALQAAHDAGVVHRDLKPANIMIAKGKRGEDVVKVVDFDISKGSQDEVKVEVTRLGYVVGTPEYMSPEQLCDGQLDGRSDVYSLALVLCKMLTGLLPFRGDNLQDIMSARLTDTPLLRLEELAPGRSFPAPLQKAIDNALKRRADDRTASSAEFAAQIRASVIPATRVVPGEKPPAEIHEKKPGKKLGMPAAIAAGVVLVATIGYGAMQLTKDEPVAQPLVQPADSIGSATATDSAALEAGGGNAAAPATTNPAASNVARPQPVQSGSDTRANTPVSSPQTTAPAPATNPLIARAPALLSSYRDRLASSPLPGSGEVRVMRDTALAITRLQSVTDRDRALAYFLAATMSLTLGEGGACTDYATRARDLNPSNRSYTRMLSSCESGGT